MSKRRVLFVGIHHLAGLPALCSTTKSGKVIDHVIANLGPDHECIKTNLFNANVELRIDNPVYKWSQRIGRREEDDILILLGSRVTHYFKLERRFVYAQGWHSVQHPSRAGKNYTDLVTKIVRNQ